MRAFGNFLDGEFSRLSRGIVYVSNRQKWANISDSFASVIINPFTKLKGFSHFPKSIAICTLTDGMSLKVGAPGKHVNKKA